MKLGVVFRNLRLVFFVRFLSLFKIKVLVVILYIVII